MNFRCWLIPETEKLILDIAEKQKIDVSKYGHDYAWINLVDGKFDRIDLNNKDSAPSGRDANFITISEFLNFIIKEESPKPSELIEYGEKIPLSQITGFFVWNGEIYLKGKFFCFDKKDTTPQIPLTELVTPIKVKQ